MRSTEEKCTYNRSGTPHSKSQLYDFYLLQCRRIILGHSLHGKIIHSLTLRPNEEEAYLFTVSALKIAEAESILINFSEL